MSRIERSEAHVYEKTRRYQVDKGTKCASVLVDFDPRREPRSDAVARAIEEVYRVFEKTHGKIREDDCDMTIAHFTCQVSIELRETLWQPPSRR